MTRKRTIGCFTQLWQRHESLYRSIFVDALNLLEVTDEQRKDEDAISEALCLKLLNVCRLNKSKPMPPQWEGAISPATVGEFKGGKSRNRPDFTCNLVNSFAQSDDMYKISLHVECKRLGAKIGSWDLKKNYVDYGVNRFDCLKHEYGKRALSGMMIGYIINEDKNVILSVVNGHLSSAVFPAIAFAFATKVELCDVILRRKTLEPKDFRLVHIWADLRSTSAL